MSSQNQSHEGEKRMQRQSRNQAVSAVSRRCNSKATIVDPKTTARSHHRLADGSRCNAKARRHPRPQPRRLKLVAVQGCLTRWRRLEGEARKKLPSPANIENGSEN
nr:hypothetical protein Itr_chr12CG13820 [Ipomoea trifida]